MRAQLRALFLLRLSVGFRVSPRPCDYSIQRSASSATVEEPIAMTANLILAAIQMTSTNDKAANLHSTICLVERAAHRGAYFIALPECSSFIGGGNFADSLVETHPRDAIAASETLDGPYMQALCQLATRLNVWLSVGGFPESINKDEEICSKLTLQPSPTKVFNTHVLISPAGTITEKYRKIHLFDSPLAGLMESKSTVAGSSLAVADCLFARVGLTTCYDLRFPELYGALCRPLRSDSENQAVDISGYGLGAEIVLVPSAFTVATGTAHWEVLLRARAIENQCYVIAAAQIGAHNEKRRSYGRSMIIDPWGEIIASCPSIESLDGHKNEIMGDFIDIDDIGSICFAPFNREILLETRKKMPVRSHRRPDVYY